MVKHKFYKNLFQTISCFSAIIVLVIFLLMGFFASLSYGHNDGWILLVISFALIALFILIGFYWIFQKVSIDESGIKIFFINKIIKEFKWKEIESIENTNIMRNPAIRIKTFNGNEIHLDKRKSIIKLIEIYSQKEIIT